LDPLVPSFPYAAVPLFKYLAFLIACIDSRNVRVAQVSSAFIALILGLVVIWCAYTIEGRFLKSRGSLTIVFGWIILLIWCSFWWGLISAPGNVNTLTFITEACLIQAATVYGIDFDPRIHF
jgi:hypothetical protein